MGSYVEDVKRIFLSWQITPHVGLVHDLAEFVREEVRKACVKGDCNCGEYYKGFRDALEKEISLRGIMSRMKEKEEF